MKRVICLLALLATVAAGCATGRAAGSDGCAGKLRLGYFPNLTHAQAVLGVADGSLARAAGVPVETRVFTAGPAGITALLAGELDLLYVGPAPAVNGYIRSGGKALRIVAGAASGGSVFVTRPGVDLENLAGTRLASPGVGNTQDVALRHWLAGHGVRSREQGGSVTVTAAAPADILTMFGRGQLDGAWVAEPWGARLVQEAGAVIAWDERDLWPDRRFATTVLAASASFLDRCPDVVRGFLTGHVALTQWIRNHPEEARARLRAGLAKLQGKEMPDGVLAAAFGRVDFVSDPLADTVQAQADRAYQLGLLGTEPPDLAGLFDLAMLREVAP